MNIALVHDWLTGMRGGEKCLEVLCRRFPRARLFTLLHAPGTTSATIERMQISTSFLQRFPGVARHYRYLLPLMPTAVGRLKIPDDVDLVVSFSHAVAKSIQPPPGVPHVCYCFTPMRYAWHRRDDYFCTSARFHKAPAAAVRNFLLDRLRDWDRATADRVTRFVAVSRTVAQRIAECYDRPAEVIYPPVDVRFYTPADVPRDDYYLCVSALVPYKRIDLAVEACSRLGRRLVVIGDGPERRRLARQAGPRVTLLGRLGDEPVRDHLRRARALLFPGHEDFGIVPVEAQACGTPVIAYGAGGATETVLPPGNGSPGTGLFFDEQTPASLCGAIERFEAQADRFDPALARRQAEQFAAERFERELVACLEETVNSVRHGTCDG
ncbi:MAG: glycosyltransferase [Candidatus Nealsonbacteria bacterium]|nr:glycosyltransferase [Candidatus Nealsonbacteria bacterium]